MWRHALCTEPNSWTKIPMKKMVRWCRQAWHRCSSSKSYPSRIPSRQLPSEISEAMLGPSSAPEKSARGIRGCREVERLTGEKQKTTLVATTWELQCRWCSTSLAAMHGVYKLSIMGWLVMSLAPCPKTSSSTAMLCELPARNQRST